MLGAPKSHESRWNGMEAWQVRPSAAQCRGLWVRGAVLAWRNVSICMISNILKVRRLQLLTPAWRR